MSSESWETEFVYVIPYEKFVYKLNGVWCINQPVGKDGIYHHLLTCGLSKSHAAAVLKDTEYIKVHGLEMAPGKPEFYDDGDAKLMLNLWVPPRLKPEPGDWPTIERVFQWLTHGDQTGVWWLQQWMAAKVQEPTLLHKVAVVLASEQGGGKGTLAYVMRAMLGFENTATITRSEIESRFNRRWIDKLFVLADEVLSNETVLDVSNKLKVYIDGAELEAEEKNVRKLSVKNRLAWMFASNDRVSPVKLEQGDRRYSVFTNYDPLPGEYVALLNGCFESDRKTPTPAFLKEMSAFYDFLLHLDVDRRLVSRPYSNQARADLIEANLSPHELFIRHVNENGIDSLLEKVLATSDFEAVRDREEWDFGDEGLSTQMLYRCYVEFVRRAGGKPMRINKLGAAINNHSPPWNQTRKTAPKARKQVYCYVVPRSIEAKANA